MNCSRRLTNTLRLPHRATQCRQAENKTKHIPSRQILQNAFLTAADTSYNIYD